MEELPKRLRDKLQIERMQRFVPLAGSLVQCEDELTLIAMLLDDYYQQTLHAIPPKSPIAEPPEKAPVSAPNSKKRRPRQRKGPDPRPR